MAIILDIAGKPLPPRNQARKRLRSQDLRDLLKILIVLSLIIIGYLTFAPSNESDVAAGSDRPQTQAAAQQGPRAG